MKRPSDEFWNITLNHISKMIDMHKDVVEMQNAKANNEYYESKYFKSQPNTQVKVIKSMREIR